ncbi:ABC transporter ATP-binding protein [Massilioclostridium coli]|uniref:ABC transporter ATP-binding protein n=1 Tax=Massilioclostridium coli TaxID=1870991 RepID=UPI0022E0ED24|nr:ABC transporter ATP-binding protein [Massilioclostridium coli]
MIEFKGVYKSYKNKSVLANINLTINDDEFFVLIGASGCGKTTLLKVINKLNSIDRGELLIDGTSVKKIKESDLPKQIGYVVQEGGLFPHMTVGDNIALTMKLAGFSKQDIQNRVDEMLEMVALEPGIYRDLYPSQLSGGQRQRVGVARAFATDPPVILMDEPFSALDPVTRNELQDEVFHLQNRTHKTVVFVTHDMDEAIKLATRICIIQNGHIVQCDRPEEILKHPANSYVEEFIGKNKLWSNPEFVKAEDIMLKRPVQASGERTVIQAIHIMGHYNVDSLLVTEDGKLKGVVWMNDLRKIKNDNDKIRNYVSDDYISVFNDTSLKKIISTIDYNISGIIPVIDHESNLKGFLTKGRMLSILSRQFTPEGSSEERSGIID